MPIHVMVGVLLDATGRVLIAQRTTGKHHAGGWEFPGGKLESGESRLDGLARELREELGVQIDTPRPLIRVIHNYSYGQVLLDVWVMRKFSGRPEGLDGQSLRWCAQRELKDADLLPADRPIVAALALPERLIEVAGCEYRIRKFGAAAPAAESLLLDGVLCSSGAEAETAVHAGADFVALRAILPADELTQLCAAICVPVYTPGCELDAAWALGASGLNQLGQ